MTFRHYLIQRITAAIMAPMVLAHVALIFIASHDGLSAAEILGRTRGSIGWAAFYGLFVVAAALHGAIGLRNVLTEWGTKRLARSPRALDGLMWAFGITLTLLGLRAVFAVVVGG